MEVRPCALRHGINRWLDSEWKYITVSSNSVPVGKETWDAQRFGRHHMTWCSLQKMQSVSHQSSTWWVASENPLKQGLQVDLLALQVVKLDARSGVGKTVLILRIDSQHCLLSVFQYLLVLGTYPWGEWPYWGNERIRCYRENSHGIWSWWTATVVNVSCLLVWQSPNTSVIEGQDVSLFLYR